MTEVRIRPGTATLSGVFARAGGSGRRWDRVAAGLCALISLIAGTALAWGHALEPFVAVAGVLAVAVLAAWRPALGLFLLAGGLPFLDFAPWTGTLLVEEFDLVVLAVAAGTHARLAIARFDARDALDASGTEPPAWVAHRVFVACALGFGLLSAIALQRGIVAGGGLRLDVFQGEADALNAWRVFKPLAGVALLWCPLRRLLRDDAPAAIAWLGRGMVAGVAITGLVAACERAAYPGAFNFSGAYRTTAAFWEMHVGGAAIDAYLALATPFVVWALWRARSPLRWGLAAALALLVGYVDLTTFARGLYLAAAVSLTLLGTQLARHQGGERVRALLLRSLAVGGALLCIAVLTAAAFVRDARAGVGVLAVCVAAVAVVDIRRARPLARRRTANLGLVLTLMLEAALVIGLGSFLRERVYASQGDLGSRFGHWHAGLDLMRGPSDWLAGIGLGRLPADYAASVPGGAFPGALHVARASEGRLDAVILSGPGAPGVPGLLALTQRVALRPGGAHRAELQARVERPTRLLLRVCEIHLLYPRACQRASIVVLPEGVGWQRIDLELRGRALTAGQGAAAWFWPRRAAFSIAVETPLASVALKQLALRDAVGDELLANGDFSRGLARWFPVAQENFVPWHVDNLVLELLIERGLPACLAAIACLAIALAGLLRGPGRAEPMAPFLAASLCGVLVVGLVSSVMDVPRVAFLLGLLAVFAVELADARRTDMPARAVIGKPGRTLAPPRDTP